MPSNEGFFDPPSRYDFLYFRKILIITYSAYVVVCNLASINKKTREGQKREKKEITVYFSPRSIVWVFNVFAQIECVCVSVWFRVDCVQLIYLKAFFFFFSKFFFRVRRCRCGGVFFFLGVCTVYTLVTKKYAHKQSFSPPLLSFILQACCTVPKVASTLFARGKEGGREKKLKISLVKSALCPCFSFVRT